MSARVRWGFDRAAGAKARPVPLVRRFVWPTKAAKPRVKHGATVENLKQVEAMPPTPASVPVAADDAPRPVPPPARDNNGDGSKVVSVRVMAPVRSSMPPPAVDWGRVADAARARIVPAKPKAAPTRVALSREGCPRCGVPGWRGCDHQLPYEDQQ